ncbi:MAG: clostripain-related cysteine peptidase [Elusimicrobiota bacterium]
MVFAVEKIDFDQGLDVKATLQAARSDGSSELPKVEPQGIPASKAMGKGSAAWTIMVFVNGKNNLSSYGVKDFNEMEAVGSSKQVNVVVELGQSSGPTKRYLVAKDDKPGEITSVPVQDLGKVDMGDWRHLAEFGSWAKANYPAQQYMLVVWNHGSGWDKNKDPQFGTRGISYDDETGNHITTQQLAMALSAMGGVDVYASDACLMQMAEVTYELRDHAGVIIGSEETEPGDGYNYTTFLGPIIQNPYMSAEQVAQAEVASYQQHYQGIGEATTQSALKAETLEALAGLINTWTANVMRANEKDVVKNARKKVQSYAVSDNIDLVQFVELVGASTKDSSVKGSGENLARFVREQMMVANGNTGSYTSSNGIAVYLPKYSVSSAYADLAWAKDCNWDDFAKWFVNVYKEGGDDSAGGGDDWYKKT